MEKQPKMQKTKQANEIKKAKKNLNQKTEKIQCKIFK
jgi:hypothetical protein